VAFNLTNQSDDSVNYFIELIELENPATNSSLKSRGNKNIPYLEVEKGEKDPRPAQTVLQASGGPDEFGYIWNDSTDTAGPEFAWVDISSSGTVVEGLSDDSVVSAIPLGFEFPFYGESFTHLNLSSNGFLSFSELYSSGCCSGQPIPNDTDSYNHLIAWMWKDLHPREGSVYHQTLQDGRFVLQFENYGEYGQAGTINAQVVLYRNGDILLQYLDFSAAANERLASIGIENGDGSDGLQVAFSDSYLQPGLAVLISHRRASWLEVDAPKGILEAGQSQTINLRYLGDMAVGNYAAQLNVLEEEQAAPALEVPIAVEVVLDTSPPVAISDLSITNRSFDNLSIEWTAAANSEAFGGPVDHISLRYSTAPITEENWSSAIPYTESNYLPDDEGTTSTLLIKGLTPQTEYYIALRSFDQAGNASKLSNVVQVSTLAPPIAELSEESFTLSMSEGSTDTLTLELRNQGDADLLFSLEVEEKIEQEEAETSRRSTPINSVSRYRADNVKPLSLSRKKIKMQSLPNEETFLNQEIIVQFTDGTSKLETEALSQAFRAQIVKSIPALNIQIWKVPSNSSMLKTIQSLNENSAIAYAEPNYKLATNAIPNDPDFSLLWGLRNSGQSGGTAGADIKANLAWDQESGSNSVVVAVIDTGINYNHPDLIDNIWVNEGEIADNGIDDDGNGFIDDVHGFNFVSNNGDPMDDNNHGTHCAGTIGASGDNGIGVVGVNHNVALMGVKFLNSWGNGSTADAVEAILYAVDNGAHILSNSWGGTSFSNALLNAIEYANANNVLFVAAAGNSGTDNDVFAHYPSNYAVENVLAVAASDHDDRLASFSQYGLSTVDLAAPGVNIYSTVAEDAYTAYSGTSMATPHVAGAAALLKSKKSRLTALDIKDILLSSTDPIEAFRENTVSGGRLNAKNALDLSGPGWILAPDIPSNAVASGESLNLELALTTMKTDIGVYQANLIIDTNDPINPRFSLPITLTVTDDGIAPGSITDLSARETDERSTIISFTAVGDDGLTGTAHHYDLRYSQYEITADNWHQATPLANTTQPQPAGETERILVGGLPANSTVWLAVQAIDRGKLSSGISNVISITTLNAQLDIEPTQIPKIRLEQGQMETFSVNLTNAGDVDLDVRIDLKGETTGAAGSSLFFMSRKIGKGEQDYRVGPPVILNQGGPDTFGYQWIDSNSGSGPEFDWQDISTTGTPIEGIDDDSVTEPIPLGFDFPFYGANQSQIYISSNGFLSFDNTSSGCCAGQPLPRDDYINHIIAWLWYDLHPMEGTVHYELVEPGRFVVQFTNYGEYAASGTIDAQVILESSGRITLQYANIQNNMQVSNASIGIENSTGDDGLQTALFTDYVEDNLALTFFPGWLSMATNALTLVPGQTESIEFLVDACSLEPGGHENKLRFISNDVVEPEKVLSIELEVIPGSLESCASMN